MQTGLLLGFLLFSSAWGDTLSCPLVVLAGDVLRGRVIDIEGRIQTLFENSPSLRQIPKEQFQALWDELRKNERLRARSQTPEILAVHETGIDEARVPMFQANEREAMKVQVQGGNLLDPRGQPLNMNVGLVSVTLDRDVISPNYDIGDETHHHSLTGGKSALFAGDWKVQEGVPLLIRPDSGHYRPRLRHLAYFVNILQERGVDLTRTQVLLRDRFRVRAVAVDANGPSHMNSSIKSMGQNN